MNTKWETEFDKEYDKSDKFITISENFSGFTETRPGKEEIKAFIKDQITKAHNNGYEDGFDRAREIALEAITYKPKTN